MSVIEYDFVPDGNFYCCECGDDTDVVIDEGRYICTECLFEEQCEEMSDDW